MSCSSDEATDEWGGSVTTLEGVITVHNPAEPLLAADQVVVTELWRYDPEEDAAEPWGEPAQVARGTGVLYVLDRLAARIHVVSDDGSEIARIARSGGGPGELRRPTRLRVLRASSVDTLLVLDNGKQQVEWFSGAGEYLGAVRLPSVTFDLHAARGRPLLVNVLRPGGARWEFLQLDGATRSADLPDAATGTTSSNRGCARTDTSDDRLLRLDCTLPIVVEIDGEGAVRRRIVIARDSAMATEAELAHLRSVMEPTLASGPLPPTQARQLMEESVASARVLRPFRELRADPESGMLALQEQRAEDLGGGPATIHLLSAEGVYLARIAFPDAWRDFAFHGGILYPLALDAGSGIGRLLALRVQLPVGTVERARRLTERSSGN